MIDLLRLLRKIADVAPEVELHQVSTESYTTIPHIIYQELLWSLWTYVVCELTNYP